MKAIILAAGQGTRLMPLTADQPKCLVPFQGRPIIDYILDAMGACGIKDITVVSGYCHEVLAAHLAGRGVKVLFNRKYETTNMVASLFCAEAEFADDLIISYADIVYQKAVLQTLLESPAAIGVVVDRDWRSLWDLRMADPLKDAETMQINPSGHIVSLGKKPKDYSEIQGQYMGLIKVSASVLDRLKVFYHSLDRNVLYDGRGFDAMFMTSFLQLVIDRLMPVTAVPVQGGWIEVDTLEDLEIYEKRTIL